MEIELIEFVAIKIVLSDSNFRKVFLSLDFSLFIENDLHKNTLTRSLTHTHTLTGDHKYLAAFIII